MANADLFEPPSQIFDFTITCAEGRVRFTDLQGQHTLQTGQRLGGGGSRRSPLIEVGEITKRPPSRCSVIKIGYSLLGSKE